MVTTNHRLKDINTGLNIFPFVSKNEIIHSVACQVYESMKTLWLSKIVQKMFGWFELLGISIGWFFRHMCSKLIPNMQNVIKYRIRFESSAGGNDFGKYYWVTNKISVVGEWTQVICYLYEWTFCHCFLAINGEMVDETSETWAHLKPT